MNLLASPGQLRASLMRWLLVCVPVVLLLGFLSGQMAGSGPGNPWFDALVKPAVYPPPVTFAIVWSVLYVMMGVALAMVLAARGARGRGIAVLAFAVQFVLNLAWSPVFFGMHRMSAALVLIAAILLAAVVTTILFARVRTVAAALLLPYVLWLVFATYLNFAFLHANPGMDGVQRSSAVERFDI
ncbi:MULTISPECIES: TspO/MBR family protein [Novosphingobium]|jgi:tryptophan-rich sensory protein|uniref:TspO/MBR family protein n=1 Tax=Novosphingobium TaxID=165696 RepID=UPI0022F24E37|nr:TspO/MBR family protein [Novosphingobium resinovorum]GLK42659.1 sensory protein TspO [Novosphingobium resinovorum]